MSFEMPKFETNVEFNPQKGVDKVVNNATSALKNSFATSVAEVIAAGGNKEVASAVAENTSTATDSASAIKGIETYTTACSKSIKALIELVQEGEFDMSDFANILKGEITAGIKNAVAQATTLNETNENLAKENEDLKQEIDALSEELGVEPSTLGMESGDDVPATDGDSKTENESKPKKSNTSKSNNNGGIDKDKQAKLKQLIEKYNNNGSMMRELSEQLLVLNEEQDAYVQQGDDVKAQAEESTNNWLSQFKDSANQFYTDIENGINNVFGTGKAKQLAHSAKAGVKAPLDLKAGIAKEAEASAAAAGSVVTFGASATAASVLYEQATAFFTAAADNTKILGVSAANIAGLVTGKTTVGALVANGLKTAANEGANTFVNNVTEQVFGQDVAQYVKKFGSEALEIAENAGDKKSSTA